MRKDNFLFHRLRLWRGSRTFAALCCGTNCRVSTRANCLGSLEVIRRNHAISRSVIARQHDTCLRFWASHRSIFKRFNACSIITESEYEAFFIRQDVWRSEMHLKCRMEHRVPCVRRVRVEAKQTEKKETQKTNELGLFGANKYRRNGSQHNNTRARITNSWAESRRRRRKNLLCPSLLHLPSIWRRWCLQTSTLSVRGE